MFGHWLNVVDLQSGDTEAFGYWTETQWIVYEGVPRRLVTGWIQ